MFILMGRHAAAPFLGHRAMGACVQMVSASALATRYAAMCMYMPWPAARLTQVAMLRARCAFVQRRAGRKGFGLFALEDIKQGQFVIEYIGERQAGLGWGCAPPLPKNLAL